MWGIFTPQAYCPLWGVKPASPWPEVKILDFHTQGRETKPCGLGSPKRTISLQGLEQNPPLQKAKEKEKGGRKCKC